MDQSVDQSNCNESNQNEMKSCTTQGTPNRKAVPNSRRSSFFKKPIDLKIESILDLLLAFFLRDECGFATRAWLTVTLALVLERIGRLHAMLVHPGGSRSTIHWFAWLLLSHLLKLIVVTHISLSLQQIKSDIIRGRVDWLGRIDGKRDGSGLYRLTANLDCLIY